MFPSKAFFAAADRIILLLKHVVTRIRLSGSIRLSVVELKPLIRTKGRGRIVLPNWRGAVVSNRAIGPREYPRFPFSQGRWKSG